MIILNLQRLDTTTKLLSIINRIAFVSVKITEDQTFKVNVMLWYINKYHIFNCFFKYKNKTRLPKIN